MSLHFKMGKWRLKLTTLFGDFPNKLKWTKRAVPLWNAKVHFFVSAYALTVLAIQEKNSYNKKNIKKLEEI